MSRSLIDPIDCGLRHCRPLRAVMLPEREVWFPPQGALGTAYLRGPWGAGGGRRLAGSARRCWRDGWRPVGPASGRLSVPSGNQLRLAVGLHADPEWLQDLGPGDLQALTVQQGSACERVLSSLDGLVGLSVLEFWSVPVDDGAMDRVCRMTGLREVNLWGTEVDRAGFSLLARLPRLRRLTVPGVRTGDTAMEAVADITSLRELDLSGSSVTDAGLAALCGAPHLARLSLWGTQITDAGLRHLATFPSLVDLDLGGTTVTDRGLDALAGMRLRHVSLLDTLVTPGGLHRLGSVLGGGVVEPAPGIRGDGCSAVRRPPHALRRRRGE